MLCGITSFDTNPSCVSRVCIVDFSDQENNSTGLDWYHLCYKQEMDAVLCHPCVQGNWISSISHQTVIHTAMSLLPLSSVDVEDPASHGKPMLSSSGDEQQCNMAVHNPTVVRSLSLLEE
jgi:hypothetical protein